MPAPKSKMTGHHRVALQDAVAELDAAVGGLRDTCGGAAPDPMKIQRDLEEVERLFSVVKARAEVANRRGEGTPRRGGSPRPAPVGQFNQTDAGRLAEAIRRYRDAPGGAEASLPRLWADLVAAHPLLDADGWDGDPEWAPCRDGSAVRIVKSEPWACVE